MKSSLHQCLEAEALGPEAPAVFSQRERVGKGQRGGSAEVANGSKSSS